MKNSLFLLFLFIGYCVCTIHHSHIKANKQTTSKHDYEGDPIEYPCSVSDLQCIRKFFFTHARCKHVHERVPDKVLIDHLTFQMSTSNISSTIVNAEITGLNGNVTSFYINKKTDNLVIAFESKPLTLASSEISFIYHPVGKEPIKLTDYLTVTYKSVIFTGVIPKIKHLQLAQLDAYAYLDDSDPEYKLGPGLGRKSKDPLIRKAYCDLISRIPDNGKESLVIQASTFTKIFIENKICNFGIHMMN